MVDVEFPRDAMPEDLRRADADDDGLTLEVQQQLGDGVVRTIAMGSSDGLRRGMKVNNTGAPISVPVGHAPSAASWTCSAARSTKPARSTTEERRADPPQGAELRRAVPSTDLLETGIKVIDLICPFAKGGKVGLFGGAGVGKTVNMLELINNIATAALRPVGVRRRRRAYPRRQRLLPRDEGRSERVSTKWRWSTAR